MSLTKQESDPHASLVCVRNTIEHCMRLTRGKAAEVASQLSDEQCDAVIQADGDPGKVRDVISGKRTPPVVEQAPKRAAKRKKTGNPASTGSSLPEKDEKKEKVD